MRPARSPLAQARRMVQPLRGSRSQIHLESPLRRDGVHTPLLVSFFTPRRVGASGVEVHWRWRSVLSSVRHPPVLLRRGSGRCLGATRQVRRQRLRSSLLTSARALRTNSHWLRGCQLPASHLASADLGLQALGSSSPSRSCMSHSFLPRPAQVADQVMCSAGPSRPRWTESASRSIARRELLQNSAKLRTSTVRASLRGASFDARSPVPCCSDARIDPMTAIGKAPVLVLSGDVRAHVRRTPPLHARAIAAARRGQRRQAAVARSGQVDGIAAGGLEPRSGTTVWPLARAFY